MVNGAPRPPHRFLRFHLAYRCRHSRACCSAGWPIPIERPRAAMVARAVADGRANPDPPAWLAAVPDLPAEMAGVLAVRGDGSCAFHRPHAVGEPGCGIHPTRPASCEHFPHACVIDPRGVHVTLSHYCPAAAALLFDEGEACVVSGPPIFPDGRVPEGLDATDALPPAGRASARRPRLLSWDEVTRWETDCIRAVAEDRSVPESIEMADFERARAAVPAPWAWPTAPDEWGAIWPARVRPAWSRWTPVIGRYLAAKVHASWAMHVGQGPVDVLRGVRMARAVLQVEAARACAGTGRTLDREALTQAIRQADLLLMHYADPRALHGSR